MLRCTTVWRSCSRRTPSWRPSSSRRRPTRVGGWRSDTAPLRETPLRMSHASLPQSRRRWRAVYLPQTPRLVISFSSARVRYNLALWSLLTRVKPLSLVGHNTTGRAMQPGRSADCCGAWRSRSVGCLRTAIKPLTLPVGGALTRCARCWRTT
jgi:hypothetical protein